MSRGERLTIAVVAAVGALLGGLRGFLTYPAQDD